jgi:histone H3/H4
VEKRWKGIRQKVVPDRKSLREHPRYHHEARNPSSVSARRGAGVSDLIYEEAREVTVFLENLSSVMLSLYTEHARRKITVTVLDVVHALKRQGRTSRFRRLNTSCLSKVRSHSSLQT